MARACRKQVSASACGSAERASSNSPSSRCSSASQRHSPGSLVTASASVSSAGPPQPALSSRRLRPAGPGNRAVAPRPPWRARPLGPAGAGPCPPPWAPVLLQARQIARPAPILEDRPSRSKERNPLLGREGDGGLGPLVRQAPFAAELRDPGCQEQGKSQAEGVRQLRGQPQGLVAPLQGLLWIAQPPQVRGAIARHATPGS